MSTSPSPAQPSLLAQNWAFFLRHHLALGIFLGVVIGAVWPEPGQSLSHLPLTSIAIFIIFLVQGLRLETEEAKDALKSWRASLYGFLYILALSPFLSYPVRLLPLDPADLTVGLCLFLTMPGTISSGVVFTRECYGNASLALLLCVGTTLVSIVTMPFTIPFFALSGADTAIDRVNFLLNLCLTILLPLVIGKAVRELVPHALHYIDRFATALKYTSSISLILLPFIQVSNATQQIRALSFTALAYTTAISALIHVAFLGSNLAVTRGFRGWLQLDVGKEKAVVICCSERTLAIAVAVLPLLTWDEGGKGVIVVAVIIAHLVQTVMDGALASWWRAKTDEEQARRGQDEGEQRRYVEMTETEVGSGEGSGSKDAAGVKKTKGGGSSNARLESSEVEEHKEVVIAH